MKLYQSLNLKNNNRTALTGVLVWMVLVMISGAAWAGPSPLPLDPPAGTEAFISQILPTQLQGVNDSGSLTFQNIGAQAGIEYNNIGYDSVTGYIYAVEITETGAGGGNRGLVRIGQDGSGNIVIQPLGWPGYPNATAPWGGDGSEFPRYDAGDVDPVSRLFFVHVQGLDVGNGCLGNPSVCTDRVRSFNIDDLPLPGADPADLTQAYGVSRVFKAAQDGPALNITARVADWAYQDGKLYGGDAATGKLAVNTPNANDDDPDPSDDPTHALFNRFDFDSSGVATALDTTDPGTADAYGAAWFIDDILYLYKNGGVNSTPAKVFKIDLQIDPGTGNPNPKIIEIVTEPEVDVVTRNDGASFMMAQGPVAFECTGEPFIVFDFASQLNQIGLDPGANTFTFSNIANPINGLQINNLGFRSTDGFLYGWERNQDDNGGQIVLIDSGGNVTGLGNPGLPTNQSSNTVYNYNAGDVSVDGTKMYLSYSQQNGAGGPLYIVDLPSATLNTVVTIKGDSGSVADWAAHPTDGRLYGGDHTNWQLAILNPATGDRTDVDIDLPNDGTLGYGAAWFNAAGRLFLYHNSGKIYAVDNVDTSPTLVGDPYPLVNATLTTRNNDGANCAAATVSAPAIDIEKSTNGIDADEPTGPDLIEGDTVTWEYVVENTGTVDLSNVTVTDDQGVTPAYVSGDDEDSILQPGEVWIYRATGVAVVGQYANIGTATGTPQEGNNVSDTDPSHYLGKAADAPSIDVEKYISLVSEAGPWDDADDAPGPQVMAGDNVWFRFVIENTGNVRLTGITLTDSVFITELSTCAEIPDLAPGETFECVIDPVEATGVAHTNIGTATGTPPQGENVSDDDPANYAGTFWAFTPGFWKNHAKGKHDVWKYTAYGTDDTLGEIFSGVYCLEDFGGFTLLEALSLRGSETISGAMEILLRAAVASLLNASFHEAMGNPIGDGGVYPYTTAEVITMVEDVLCSEDRAMILDLAGQLDALNNGIHYIDWKWPAP
jgi:hypothetical protein